MKLNIEEIADARDELNYLLARCYYATEQLDNLNKRLVQILTKLDDYDISLRK